ncbi:universal stress protein UspA-like protein [Salinisphaera sp. PC39]|uniref:universal stress protein n=1 Tax=Salinisphaera sp. PC39 TaxID=1304156 RepID=UPI00333E687C
MILTGRILFPVFPADGHEAEHQLAALAAHTGHSPALLTRRLSREPGEAEGLLDSVAGRLDALGAPVAARHIVDGNLADAVLRCAEEDDAAMIFMPAGPEAREDVRHTGVEAEAIARNARRPVWIAKPHTPAELETVICAVDERRASAEALKAAIELARCYSARLRIVRAAHPPADGDPVTVAMDERERVEARQSAGNRIENAFEDFLEGFNVEGLPRVEHRLLWADRASRAITDAAGENPNALLVLGSSGVHRFLRPMLGTTSERVLQHAPCSLLFVKY